jgi:hypothetical protein
MANNRNQEHDESQTHVRGLISDRDHEAEESRGYRDEEEISAPILAPENPNGNAEEGNSRGVVVVPSLLNVDSTSTWRNESTS